MSLTFNIADLWEAVVDSLPDSDTRLALITSERTLTYDEFEARTNRIAAWMAANGIGQGDPVGLYLYNGTEYVEAMLAAFKLRAVPINVNYRYVEDELLHLFNDAGIVALVHDHEFADRVAGVRERVPTLRTVLAVGGDPNAYEEASAAQSADRVPIDRSADDLYVIYTGGTTGLPKGVVWRQEDAFYACFGGGDYARRNPVAMPDEVPGRAFPQPLVFFPIAPLMHGAAQWTVFAWLIAGGTNVLAASRPRTDYAEVWRLITEHGAHIVTVIGDAVARPFLEEYRAHTERYDASTLFTIGSGGAPLSAAGRAEILALFPNILVNDGYGASETGAQAGNLGDGRFESYDQETLVLDPVALEPVPPGSDREGRVARRGHIPLRYHNDPEKSAATFVERDGVRWVLTGDSARVLEDGTIALLGRGSQCINTGGEKVFPEEVEGVLVAHPFVFDALVVGVPDDRWGERVAAVVQLRTGAALTLEELQEHCRSYVAAFKVPRELVLVDEIVRSPVGKPDYRWAKEVANHGLGRRA